MSNDWYDDDDYHWYKQEEYETSLYEDFRAQYVESGEFAEDVDRDIDARFDQIINTKIQERVRTFYISNPDTAKPAVALLAQGQALLELGFYSPAQVFAGAAAEVIFKHVLFFPIVHGFVPLDGLAQMVVAIFSKSVRELGRFQGLLIHVVMVFSGIDMTTYKTSGSNKGLWDEACHVRHQRNTFLHDGKPATKEDAERSIVVATTLLSTVFDALLKGMLLHRHNDGSIKENLQCSDCT